MHFNDHDVLCCSFFLWWMTIPFYQLGSQKFYGAECRFLVHIKLFMGRFWSEWSQFRNELKRKRTLHYNKYFQIQVGFKKWKTLLLMTLHFTNLLSYWEEQVQLEYELSWNFNISIFISKSFVK